ncbi:MAG: guanylate kinase [Erysipelotrichaceae bacterium]|nr:guanylate kinase [Erysipelotrichaceae bacterium]
MAGKLIVLSGASSIGKKDMKKALLEDKDLGLLYVISMTTRPKKENEVDGVDYYFTETKNFAKSVSNKELLEYTEFNGYYYGTPKNQVMFLLQQNKNVLVDVEAEGVGPIKLNVPEALCIFLMPKSLEDLEQHIHDVYGDDTANERLRINKARMEMEIAPLFRNQVVMDDFDQAFLETKKMILDYLNQDN